MDRSCWVGENQALFRQSERDRSIGLLRRNWGRLCVSRSDKEQKSRRQRWKEWGMMLKQEQPVRRWALRLDVRTESKTHIKAGELT